MPISLLFEHFTLFLSWFPSYQSFLVFFLPMIISPWVSSWALIQAHTLIVMSHLPSFVYCSSDFMCPLWSNLATYVDSQIYVNFGLTNMYPALNSKYAKHNLWDAQKTEKSIVPSQLSFLYSLSQCVVPRFIWVLWYKTLSPPPTFMQSNTLLFFFLNTFIGV